MRLTLNEIALAAGGRLTRPESGDMVVCTVSTDSRSIEAGALFVPIKGDIFDGHEFILQAFEGGASAALSSVSVDTDRPLIEVPDTRKALMLLASHYLKSVNPKKVAITGSNGKTTTKDLIAAVLSRKFKTHKTKGNLNNDIGLPLTVLSMPEDTEAAVFEMGMNHLGEISVLSRAVEPDIAVITNIGTAHIENLGSKEGILRAKLEILEGLAPPPVGLAVFNGDDEFLKGQSAVFYGFGNDNRFKAANVVKTGVRGVSFTAVYDGPAFDVSLPYPGLHMVYNALAAIAVGVSLGLPPDEIKAGLEDFTPSGHRMNIVKKLGMTIIDDAYNANLDSMKSSLDVLAAADGRRIAVLGGMLELGEFAEEMHREVGEYAVKSGIDLVVCVGPLSEFIYESALRNGSAVYFKDKSEAADYLRSGLREGDIVLFKASRGMAFEDILSKLEGD